MSPQLPPNVAMIPHLQGWEGHGSDKGRRPSGNAPEVQWKPGRRSEGIRVRAVDGLHPTECYY